MIKAIQIELLKSKRTKSFFIVSILLVIATIWNILTFSAAIKHPELKVAGTLFSNQNVNLFMLPIAVCIFASRIVGNEHAGQTFKLQVANGQQMLTIFNHKFLFMMLLFSVLSILEVGVISFFGIQAGISIPFTTVSVQIVGQLLAIFSLICLYLTFAMIIEKQGILWALGLLGGFISIVLNPGSDSFVSLLNPLTGSGSLAPYKYQFIKKGLSVYIFDNQIFMKMIIYVVQCFILYGLARIILRRKGN
ncbi:ABC transporter permease [Streptococcus uberis]|nr:ABC transporter permease [Streptococcus uberis]MCK1255507.1 ABC transporter permease [Streptococcus uberis]